MNEKIDCVERECFLDKSNVTEKDDGNGDIVQKAIGVFGKWHIWVCLAIFLVKFPVAWHQLSIVFLAPPMNFTCISNATDKCSANCPVHIFDRSTFTETIISQWDLVCDKAYLANLAQTITMLGILFGNMIFGYLSDKFGRRVPLIGAVVLQVVAGTWAAFSPWFTLFLAMRFLSAIATGGTMVTSFVLIMELIGTRWRTTVGILYQIPFNLGHLTLPLFSYFLRDWRYFQVAISVPALILVSYYWVLPESPRWLLTTKRADAAVAVLERAAHHNGLPTAPIRAAVDGHLRKGAAAGARHTGNFLDLVRTPIMRTYTFCICFNWLVCGLCFFGVAQFIGQLGGDIFLNVALSALVQIPSTLFSIQLMGQWGRRRTLIAANLVAGLALILIGAAPARPLWAKSVLSCVGIFALAIAFPTVYIYSGELFPTVVRNSGVGTSSMCARLGSMSAPFVAGLAALQPWLPPLVFGVTPLIGALLCYRLPETLDCKLPDTIEEAEMYEHQRNKTSAEAEMKPC